MNEPVNIMGVTAFPNPHGGRGMRFIDSAYNTLFVVPDGGNVVIRGPDGTISKLSCRYIDDYHTLVGSCVFHICEFAEMMEQSGCTYEPERPREGEKQP